MRTTWKPFSNKTKLTFLFPLTFLFLFSGFVNGEEPGVYKDWHPNGIQANLGQYKEGKEDGKWVLWSKDGNTQTKKFYKNGKEQ